MSKYAENSIVFKVGTPPSEVNPVLNRLSTALMVATVAFLAVGCNVGPNYKRPVANTPVHFRGALAPDLASVAGATSLADQQWSTVFQDPVLIQLVDGALKSNLDVQIAAKRVLQAQAQVGIARSQQFPVISGGGSYAALQLPSSLATNNSNGTPGNTFFNGGGPSASGSWNLDFWGLYRRQSEAARADLLATEWAQRATRTAIIEGVADSYFQLRRLDSQLAITQESIKARSDSLRLVSNLQQRGAGSLADVRQAEELLHAAQANLPEIRRQIAIQENTLSILLGKNPESIDRGRPVDQQPHPEQLPVGLPSELIERRPDIRQAEAKLIAANARIGVAKAQFFPNISLTALGGSASNQLQNVVSGQNNYWFAAGSITEPIFDGGSIRSNYHLSQAEQQQALLNYRKTILGAFKEVSDSLVTYKESSLIREEKAAQAKSAADAVRLARLRFAAGDASYLEVLTTDTVLYDAQLSLTDAQELEAASLVDLFAVLGGGWN
jgi:outer membrane protein, multidrug efflux system